MTAVAIDGPAGAGKSSVARAVAKELGFRYLDTGAMYRAVALAALEAGVDVDDEVALGELVGKISIEMEDEIVRVDGRDVTSLLRAKDVTSHAARVARHLVVRQALVDLQRSLAAAGDVVMEGRDIGSEVLPEAEAKFFLTASLSERAERRSKQLGLPTDPASLAELERDIESRDRSDTERMVSPLVRAPDATVIDTTGMSLDEVAGRIAGMVRAAGEAAP